MESRANTEKHYPFEVSAAGHDLILSGSLNKFTQITGSAERAFRAVAKLRRATIDASEVSVLEGGTDAWIRVVQEYFKNCELRYRPSQLGMVLKYDDEYLKLHPRSVFEGDD
jgi:hypothetical protein